MTDNLLIDGPRSASRTFAFAHGAGAGMEHPFMADVARGIARHGIRVVRFEFPYMRKRRRALAEGAKVRGYPDRAPVLEAAWREAISHLDGSGKLVIGGKSMGGRIASMVADDAGVDGLVCLGYPFHPPGKPETLRTAHLERLGTPTLIVQGTRDVFGKPEEVAGYPLSKAIRLVWLEDGDHSFKPRKASGRTHDQNIDEAVAAVSDFVAAL